jgi:hypothetical protein
MRSRGDDHIARPVELQLALAALVVERTQQSDSGG